MKRIPKKVAVGLVAVVTVACMDTNGPSFSLLPLTDAFTILPAGFTATSSSFSQGDGSAPAFIPGMFNSQQGPGGMMGGGPGPGGMIGGGMGADFVGGVGAERGFGHGPFGGAGLSSNCALNASTGRVVCPAETRDGITINRSFAFTTAAGTVQAKPDSTTNTANSQTSVTGTVTRRDSATSTVSNTSNQTVAGLAYNSTQRTVNGTAGGTESTTGKINGASFTALRTVGDTTSGLVIPVVSGKPTYPTAGKVVRQMKVTMSVGGAATTKERREVITYNGTATASIVITQDGTTKTCTLPLPHGKPSCN